MGDWIITTLGRAPLEIIDGDRGSNYPGQDEFFPSGYCLFLNAGNVTTGGFSFSNCAFITREKDEALRKGRLRRNDVVLTTRGTVGNAAYFDADVPFDHVRINSGMVILRAQPPMLQPLYLYHFVRSTLFHAQVEALRTGSAQPQLPIRDINRIKIPLPPAAEQLAIAAVLGALDDKIDLNRRMNETLEAMAGAIFKDWFVDFGPTRAKMEGRAPSLAQELWAVFPDRLDDKGKPEGWRITVLEDVLGELETGGRPKGGVSVYTSGVPSIGAESIVGLGKFDYAKTKYVPPEFFEAMTKGHVKSGDVLLYKDGGRPGEFEPHLTVFGDGFPFDTFAINEHVYRIRAKPDFGQALLYFWLSSELVMEEMRIKGTGVAIPGLNSTQVKSLTTLVPLPDVARSFDALVEPMISRILANCNESRSLAKTRDLLLPKLMSGEIRLREAEKALEAAL